jgi:hypothetical protein
MQLVKGKPPETQYATRPGAGAKRREVALGRPGFEPGRIRAWLSLRPPQGETRAPGVEVGNSCKHGGRATAKRHRQLALCIVRHACKAGVALVPRLGKCGMGGFAAELNAETERPQSYEGNDRNAFVGYSWQVQTHEP